MDATSTEIDRKHEAFRVLRDPATYEVMISSDITLDDYRAISLEEDMQQLVRYAGPLKDKTIVFINPTMAGGGVAMMRPPLVHMLRQLGVDAHWFVMEGKYSPDDPDPFVFTKLMHNISQRRTNERITDAGKRIHQEWCRRNAEVLVQQPVIQHADIIVIDDPQPAPLKQYIEAVNPDVKFIWRNHIDTSHELMSDPQAPQAEVSDYVLNECDIKNVAAIIAHPVWAFLHPGVEDETYFAPATIDPFDDLNRDLQPSEVPDGIRFINQSIDELNASTLMHDANDTMPYVDSARSRLCLVARFDESKGMDNALELGVRTRRILRGRGMTEADLPQVVVVGNGSVDDPSGVPLFETMLRLRRERYPTEKHDIIVMRLRHNYTAMNALMYALPNERYPNGPPIIGMQLSFAEGLETRITDWISHGVPVVVANRGGMPLQVIEGESGIIIDYDRPDYDLDRGAEFASRLLFDQAAYARYTETTSEAYRRYNEREFSTVANAIRLMRIFDRVLSESRADKQWKLTEGIK